MMDAMTFTAGQLGARKAKAADVPDGDTKAGRMRKELRDNGRKRARDLAAVAGLPDTSLVSSLLRHDLAAGRVHFACGWYEWNFDYDGPSPRHRLDPGQEVITWHAVAESLPDADITVLVRTRGSEEPVWLGYLDGEQWRDVEGLEIEVTHWAELPLGPQ